MALRSPGPGPLRTGPLRTVGPDKAPVSGRGARYYRASTIDFDSVLAWTPIVPHTRTVTGDMRSQEYNMRSQEQKPRLVTPPAPGNASRPAPSNASHPGTKRIRPRERAQPRAIWGRFGEHSLASRGLSHTEASVPRGARGRGFSHCTLGRRAHGAWDRPPAMGVHPTGRGVLPREGGPAGRSLAPKGGAPLEQDRMKTRPIGTRSREQSRPSGDPRTTPSPSEKGELP